MQVFTPAWNSTIAVTNAATATAAVELPFNARSVLLTNTSATARVHVLITSYPSGIITGSGDAPTLTTGVPILPSGQIRVGLVNGAKVIRTIATAADGTILLTPGEGG